MGVQLMNSHLRAQFPQLNREVWGQPLVYLDNAATTLKPTLVIEALKTYYSQDVANIHRGAHFLGDLGTTAYEGVREKVRAFINARSMEEIVFTRGTTEGLNLLAQTLGRQYLKPGDQILLTEMEHHSNIVPWQIIAEQTKAEIQIIPINEQGDLDLVACSQLMSSKVKILSFSHLSNALGTVNPVKEIVKQAKKHGILTVIDAAQSVALRLVDVQDLDCDFLVFSGHKLFAPNGVGVLYGRKEIFEKLPPYQGGGSMIQNVDFAKTTFLGLPHRFEAGTPAIGDVVGLGAALQFLDQVDVNSVREHEVSLTQRLVDGLKAINGVRLVGTSSTRLNIVSFLLEGAHPSDLGPLLDRQGVAVRAGHHCCQPLMKKLKIPGTLRASISIYNNKEDVDTFLTALEKVKGLLQ